MAFVGRIYGVIIRERIGWKDFPSIQTLGWIQRIHFSGKMDVTVNKGAIVRGSFETYLARKDYQKLKYRSLLHRFKDGCVIF